MKKRFLSIAIAASMLSASALATDAQPLSFGLADSAKKLLGDAKSGSESLQAWSLWSSAKGGKSENIPKIFELAKKGNVDAQNLAGYLLDNGEGVKKDSAMALTYFKSAAEQLQIAKYNMGVLLFHGRGVAKNEAASMPWFEQAPDVPQANVRLAVYYLQQGKMDQSWKWANEAAFKGNSMGQYLVGRILYERGQYKEAYLWLMKAVGAGEKNSAALLAHMYANGKGLDANNVMAAGWQLVYTNFDRSRTGDAISSANNGLSNDDQIKAAHFANDWLANHKFQAKVEYTKTIIEIYSK